MAFLRFLVGLAAFAGLAFSTTFGTVVPGSGGASYSDILLDQARQRIYLVNSSANRIDVYSLQQKAFLSAITTDAEPVAMAFSPDGNTLYVTAYTEASLDIIDLTKAVLSVTNRVGLPASPEGVAAGVDGRVLISTIGNSGQNVLLVYDPSQTTGKSIMSVAVPLAAPTPPTLPAPSSTPFLSYHSKLITTADGNYIVGTNITSTSTTNGRIVFVYEVSSATVLRSRIVANLSNVLAVAPNGVTFMAGSTLFDTATLSIIAQENVANAPFAFPAGVNFNTQAVNSLAVQGGAVWTPDGTSLMAAFNFAPVTNPASAANISRLLQNDPDNLLIKLGLEMPESLSGRMVITSSGDTIYALSQSGFIILPISTVSQGPLAIADSQVVLVVNDQCGVNAAQKTAVDNITNSGKGRITVSAQTYTVANTGTASVTTTAGGAGGTTVTNPGGIVITGGGAFGPGGGNGGIVGVPGGGGTGGTTTVTTTTAGVLPVVQTRSTTTGGQFVFQYNPTAATSLGTSTPSDFLIQAPEAINIPANIRVFQNNRNADSSGTILLAQQNISSAETLMDMTMDTARQRIYVANSGLNQVEVIDMKTQKLMTPIKVGQLPHSLAMSTDGTTMYVANTGGESISIVDLTKMQTVGRVAFPPIPTNVAVALSYPVAITTTQNGLQFVMTNGTTGTLWKVDGTTASPRTLNPAVFGGTTTTAVTTVAAGNPAQFSMASTPAGEYAVLVTGAGNAYLYDSSVDDFTVVKSVFTAPLTGFIGPITAGPKGAYYVANGAVLNSSLTKLSTNSTVTSRPVAAVTAISATSYAMFTTPIRTSATAAVTDAGEVQIFDVNSGVATRTAAALESPLSTIVGTTARATIPGRTLLVDSAGGYAYALTTSGISVIPLPAATTGGGLGGLPVSTAAANTPRINTNGVVSLASYLTPVAPGGLISIFGQALAANATYSTTVLPTILGGVCVTLNNVAIPLSLTSASQINAQIPVTQAAGRVPLIVRSVTNQTESTSITVTVTKYAPAVFVSGSQAAVFHDDGSYVTSDNPTTRDQNLIMYATGFGVTHGAAVASGTPAPSGTLAVTDPVSVYFGDPSYSQSAIIVASSAMAPGMIGVVQLNLTVPGTHMKGDALPIVLKIGNVTSPTTGPAIPTIAVQ